MTETHRKRSNVLAAAISLLVLGFLLGHSDGQVLPPDDKTPAKTTAKKPVPVGAELAAAEAAFQQAFKDDNRTTVAREKLVDLAARMQAAAAESSDQPAERYVLLRHARDTAVKAGDIELSMAIVSELCAVFAIDDLAETADAIDDLTKSTARQPPAIAAQLAALSLSTASRALIDDQFNYADSAIASARTSLARCSDKVLAARLATLAAEIQQTSAAYGKLKTSLAALKDNPQDAPANLAVGKYRCFLKRQWELGLPLLVVGSDDSLKALAKRDLAQPQDAAAQLVVADGWWDAGEKLADSDAGRPKRATRERAAYWYGKAVGKLTGLSKARADSRLKEIGAIAPLAGTAAPRKTFLTELSPATILVLGGKNGQTAADRKSAPKIVREPFSLGGKAAEHGLKMHPPADKASSRIVYQLGKKYVSLSGTAGIVDGLPERPKSALTFRIVGDGKELWKSQPLSKSGQSAAFEVNVAGVDKLELFVDCPGRNHYAHAAWLDPQLAAPPERIQELKPADGDGAKAKGDARPKAWFMFEGDDPLTNKGSLGDSTLPRVTNKVSFTKPGDADAPPAVLGRGIRLADGADREALAIDKSLFYSSEWTLTYWFRRAAANNQDYLIYLGELNGSPGGCPALNLVLEKDGSLHAFNYRTFRPSSKDLDVSVPGVTTGQWHFLAVTFAATANPAFNSGDMHIYLDGKEVIHHDKAYFGVALRNSKSSFMVGSLKRPGSEGARTFAGAFADIRVYDYPMTAADITREWNRVKLR